MRCTSNAKHQQAIYMYSTCIKSMQIARKDHQISYANYISTKKKRKEKRKKKNRKKLGTLFQMWKFNNFSATNISEINFGKFRIINIAIFTVLRTLDFEFW